jgi:hypothetical protein
MDWGNVQEQCTGEENSDWLAFSQFLQQYYYLGLTVKVNIHEGHFYNL